MPWWFWILLWTLLALFLLVVLAVGAFYLFRQGMRAFDELSAAGDRLSQDLTPDPGADGTARTGEDSAERLPAGLAAIAVGPDSLRPAVEAGQTARREARIRRRIETKRSAGRPQRYSDIYPE